MDKTKTLGVLGGMGPMASVYFYELVTAHTLVEKDQDHLDIILSSRASTPDRTAYILDDTQPDPFLVMADEAARLVQYGAEVLAIPCNTAHYFTERLEKSLPIPVLNMVRDTVVHAAGRGVAQVGILATDGTVLTETYQRACREQGLGYCVPEEALQRRVMGIIYDIKAGREPDMEDFHSAADSLFAAGCEAVVLGCTELSLVKKRGGLDGRYIDSMEVLARHAITACGKTPVGFDL